MDEGVATEGARGGTALQYSWRWAVARKYPINIILAFIAVGLEFYYSICGGACSYLQGSIFTIPLQYVGIGYMAVVVLLSLLKRDTLLWLLLAAGVGVEFYLVGFQVYHNTYCPYCLAFAGIVALLFLLNRFGMRNRIAITIMAATLALFALFFEGSLTPSYGEEVLVPTFGEGKANVTLYTDYFCGPCKHMEPDVEPLLRSLMERKVATITLVDTPFSKLTPLYARYFLYAVNARKDIESAFAVRRILNEASGKALDSPEKLEVFMKEKGVALKPLDPKPSFAILSKLIKANEVQNTPTCIIEKDGNKEKVVGGPAILKALKELK